MMFSKDSEFFYIIGNNLKTQYIFVLAIFDTKLTFFLNTKKQGVPLKKVIFVLNSKPRY